MMKSKNLPAGVKRAIHVFTPALVDRLKNKKDQPVMAVRSAMYGYENMMIVRKVEILGASEMVESFDNPLPGTDGRGVAILFTSAEVRVWFDDSKPLIVNTKGKTAEQVQAEAAKRMSRKRLAA